MTAAEAIAYASCLRQRLRNPPNAVRDTEIDLGRQSNAARSALREKVARERIEAEPVPQPACWSMEPILVPIFERERVRRIQITVASEYGMSRLEIMSRRRGGLLIRPRQIAMYLCTILTTRSTPEIGRLFDRDHTTILHARDKIARLRKEDAKLNAEIEALIEKLGMTEDA